jgi:hypothetical protein
MKFIGDVCTLIVLNRCFGLSGRRNSANRHPGNGKFLISSTISIR